MSVNTNKTRATLQNILNFIQAEPSYLNITSQHNIDLSKVMAASQVTYANSITMGQDLAAIFTSWSQLNPSLDNEAGEAIMRQMVIQIDAALEELERLRKSSSTVNIEANEVISQLNSVSITLHSNYEKEQTRIQQCNKDITATVTEIKKINSELRGSSGFWEGFKTGITFGIYSGLRDKLSAQSSLRATYTIQLIQYKTVSGVIQADINAINQIDPALSSVNSLDASIVDLENTMLALETLVTTTEKDDNKVVSTQNGKVAEFYKNRFNKDMVALLEWHNIFPS